MYQNKIQLGHGPMFLSIFCTQELIGWLVGWLVNSAGAHSGADNWLSSKLIFDRYRTAVTEPKNLDVYSSFLKYISEECNRKIQNNA